VTAVALDNTGRRERGPAVVLPSVEFPSDHALVSATLRIRRPAAAAAAAAASAAAGLSPRPLSAAAAGRLTLGLGGGSGRGMGDGDSRLRGGGGERTLYDYYGLGARPVAVRLLAERRPRLGAGLALPAGDGGLSGQRCAAVEADLAGVCRRRYAQVRASSVPAGRNSVMSERLAEWLWRVKWPCWTGWGAVRGASHWLLAWGACGGQDGARTAGG
jgi:hypothetical protein